MAYERDKAEWNRISGVIAAIRNSFRTDGRATQPDECTPYGKGSQSSGPVPLRRDNLDILKQFTQGLGR